MFLGERMTEKERVVKGREGAGGVEKRVTIPLTISDVMLMRICPAGCERMRGGGGGKEGCRKETPQH